jgi:hypothetical protein
MNNDGTVSQYGNFYPIPKCMLQGQLGKVLNGARRAARKQSSKRTVGTGNDAKVAEVSGEPVTPV